MFFRLIFIIRLNKITVRKPDCLFLSQFYKQIHVNILTSNVFFFGNKQRINWKFCPKIYSTVSSIRKVSISILIIRYFSLISFSSWTGRAVHSTPFNIFLLLHMFLYFPKTYHHQHGKTSIFYNQEFWHIYSF